MVKLLILACFIAIVLSLGSALVHLVRGKGDSKKMLYGDRKSVV